ncbi:MAG: protein tyrosine phosphatase family protein [Casimicrobiaceae bacterium]
MQPLRLAWLDIVAMVFSLAVGSASAQSPALRAPNVVEISPLLVTSGQPSAAGLAALAAQGFAAVVNLAPPAAMGAVKDEALIVRSQGLDYVNIPIDFERPTARDFEAFSDVMRGFAGRKVLVHCQINMRASTMVFLYRTIVAKEDPRVAYDSVIKIWVPEGPWKRLIQDQLRAHKIDFEPF